VPGDNLRGVEKVLNNDNGGESVEIKIDNCELRDKIIDG